MIDPEKSLAKYQISCIVDSVCYYPDGRDSDTVTYTCAVVLEVGFLPLLTQGENFSTWVIAVKFSVSDQ